MICVCWPHLLLAMELHEGNPVGTLSGFWKEFGSNIDSVGGCSVECLIFCEVLLLLEGMSNKEE